MTENHLMRYLSVSILAAFCVCSFATGAERKGLAIIGLSRLKASSVEAIAAGITDSGAQTVEYSYMPWFHSTSPFTNAKRLHGHLTGVRKVESIYLSWKDETGIRSLSASGLDLLRSRASSLNVYLNGNIGKLEKVIIIPVLEDQWDGLSTWMKATRAIAERLSPAHRGKVFFRRSVEREDSAKVPSSNLTLKLSDGKSYSFTSTRVEAHRRDHQGSSKVISNDGGMVAQTVPVNVGNGLLRETLSRPSWADRASVSATDWTGEANSVSKVSLLWRPSFNLFSRQDSSGVRTWLKPERPLRERSDPGVDLFERRVIAQFLRN